MYVGGVAGVGFSATANAQISSVAYTDLQAGCSQTFTPYAWHYLTDFNGEGHASSQCDDSSTVTVEASVDPDLCAGVVCGDFGTWRLHLLRREHDRSPRAVLLLRAERHERRDRLRRGLCRRALQPSPDECHRPRHRL